MINEGVFYRNRLRQAKNGGGLNVDSIVYCRGSVCVGQRVNAVEVSQDAENS